MSKFVVKWQKLMKGGFALVQEANRKLRIWGYWISPLLIGLGILMYFLFPSFSFFGVIVAGLGLLVALYLLVFYIRRRKPKLGNVLLILLSICVGIGLILAVITGVFIWQAGIGDPNVQCDYVVVLGAGVNGTVPSLSLQDRLDAAYAYLIEHPDTICIVSGGKGNGEDISEAECMARELTAMGIPQQQIWLEDQSTTTRENLRFSMELIEKRTGSRPTEIGLVTSEYHQFRANRFAAEQGVKALGIPAETSWLSLRINYFLREIVAVWYYVLLGG